MCSILLCWLAKFKSAHVNCRTCTGHGFKLSPVVGKVLSELVLDLTPSYDLSPFKMSRFQKVHGKL